VTPISDIETATNARYEIERVLMGNALWELMIGDLPATTLSKTQFEFQLAWGKLIFLWWDENHSQSWRIHAYEVGGGTVRLQAVRGLGRELILIVLRDPARPAPISGSQNLLERKKWYRMLLAGLLERELGGSLTPAPGRSRRVTGGYARWVGRFGGRTRLILGVSQSEAQVDIDGIVGAGLVWLEEFQQLREAQDRAESLVFCLPRNRSQTAIERLTFLTASYAGVRLNCLEIDEDREELTPRHPSTQHELLTHHPIETSWPSGGSVHNALWTERILALAPDLIETRTRPGHEKDPVVGFLIRGLEFARQSSATAGNIHFGVIGAHEGEGLPGLRVLSEANFDDLKQLIGRIAHYRAAEGPNRRHPFYRLREEAWLESMLRRDIRSLDESLDPRYVYSQIPTWRGEERSVIDLLCVNHEGRLVVIEIKAVEDPQLPLQGLDYWIRVEQARLRGEFPRRGFFPGVQPADSTPLLYLVAPRLRFHRSFRAVARALSPEIEAFQIGLGGDWRKRIKVHSRDRVN
jgi:hypothetical protein